MIQYIHARLNQWGRLVGRGGLVQGLGYPNASAFTRLTPSRPRCNNAVRSLGDVLAANDRTATKGLRVANVAKRIHALGHAFAGPRRLQDERRPRHSEGSDQPTLATRESQRKKENLTG